MSMKCHQCPTLDQNLPGALPPLIFRVHKMNEFVRGGREPGSRLTLGGYVFQTGFNMEMVNAMCHHISLLYYYIIGMYFYKIAKRRRLKYLVRQTSVASADTRLEQEMFSRHCLVISNNPGGGEQDTSMTTTRWERRYAPQAQAQAHAQLSSQRGQERDQKRRVKFDLSTTSYNSSNDSLAEPENLQLVATRTTTSSPTIQAVLEERLRVANEEYRNLDAIREYEDEGTCSEASSLSDICSGLEGEQYTVEHLMRAGPQFSQFVGLLEIIMEEEEELNDSAGSEVAHTGMTQATPLTTTQTTQVPAEFPYY